MQITPLSPADADVAAEMVAELIAELSPGTVMDRAATAALALRLLSSGRVQGYLARTGGLPVGVMMLNDCAALYAGGEFGEITELYVLPDWRSQGVASALIARAVEHGQAAGWRRIEVGAPAQPAWARSLAFYRREGFDEIGPRLRRRL